MPDIDTIVVVAVCTYRRPAMLQKCLHSIVQQKIPENWDLKIVVIENDQAATVDQIVANIGAASSRSITYVLEREQGIPFARNAAINQAISHRANWLIFIDDDETADTNWLQECATAIRQHPADIIHGAVVYQFPAEDRWAHLLHKNSKRNHARDGREVHSAATNNVMIPSRIFDEWGMRFDPALRFSGGEDTEFFNKARIRGARILATSQPKVYAFTEPERCRLTWMFKREAGIGAVNVYIDAKHYGKPSAIRKHASRSARNLVQGILRAIASPFSLLKGTEAFRLQVLQSTLKIGRGWGGLVGIQGKLFSPYKETDGY